MPAGFGLAAAHAGERPHTPATIPGIASGAYDQNGSVPTTSAGDDSVIDRTWLRCRIAYVIMSLPAYEPPNRSILP